MFKITFLTAALLLPVIAQRPTLFEGRPAHILENDKLELVILSTGGAFASLTLKADATKTDPMWNPTRMDRERGNPGRGGGGGVGHFVCVDGFGPTSVEERAAGLTGHGEAHTVPWLLTASEKQGPLNRFLFQTRLPLVQELFTRKLEVVDGEQVVAVESTLENLLAFDRPINWAEHATVGAPFLAPGKTVVDASVGRCQARPVDPQPIRRLSPGKEFTYPMGPTKDGGTVDLRGVPDPPNSLDHTGCTVDPTRTFGFVTVLNLEKEMLIGYFFRREEYPWLQEWMNYPASGALSRGIEFGTQPFDVPRRQTIEMARMFDVPTYRWLPARAAIKSRFLMFFTAVPKGFTKVDDVTLSNGKLTIIDKKASKQVVLNASQAGM